ncbi:MAG TPA: peptide chain release factor N(5)-glutamine methyltransferase [Gemmataceae bacterium]|nr:peptide chain release factor N(5)-glutamine methyltransferase [Gemmataceae bacterium]
MPPEPAPQTPTVWTIKALLAWTTEFLAKKGNPSARLQAQVLLAHVLNCPRIELVARSDEVPAEADRTRFRELIKRRVDGWPVAYLTGEKEFYLLKFEVSPAVLIPRPETETLVLEALRLLKPLAKPTVLDLGSGSGCISVSIAHQKPDARITAVDISPDALDIARRNAERHGVAGRMAFVQGDLFNPVPPVAFDLVVSNPPYVTPVELAELDVDVREHEPRLALDGGTDGLAFYRRIAAGVGAFLKPGGWVLVEIGATQEEVVRGLFAERPELEIGKTLRDGHGLPRVVCAKKR